MVPAEVGTWVLDDLPQLNRAILRGAAPPEALTGPLRSTVLPRLPEPGGLPPVEARRLLVHLGFVGASVARHYQEHTPGGTEQPERAFDGLGVGERGRPFRPYFADLADRTGTGHYHRDSYASLVRWNVGTVEVRLGPERLATLPGVFDDSRIRTYTGSGAERRFFALVKKGEAIELAVNDLLEPLTAPGARFEDSEAVARVRTAAVLLRALRQLFADFAAQPPERSMPPEHFLDVFRQFAVHWTEGDIPPSGALDPEALKRDFLLGLPIPGYRRQVRRLLPALLTNERAAVEALMARPTLPERLAASLGIDLAALADTDHRRLAEWVDRHPVLADWYRLLTAHGRAAGAHLMLSKRYLFKPQHARDAAGLGDRPLVSNRAGTTGMSENYLERLTRARRDHVLAPLRRVVSQETVEDDVLAGVRSDSGAVAPVAVLLVA